MESEHEMMLEMAPELCVAVDELDIETISLYIEHKFDLNFKLTAIGVRFYSLLMGFTPAKIEERGMLELYIKTLK